MRPEAETEFRPDTLVDSLATKVEGAELGCEVGAATEPETPHTNKPTIEFVSETKATTIVLKGGVKAWFWRPSKMATKNRSFRNAPKKKPETKKIQIFFYHFNKIYIHNFFLNMFNIHIVNFFN